MGRTTKDWAELNSSCKLQVRATGKVKKPTPQNEKFMTGNVKITPAWHQKCKKAVSMICKDPGAKLCTVETHYNLKSESQIQQLK